MLTARWEPKSRVALTVDNQYVSADLQLDPDGEDLPRGLTPHLRAMQTWKLPKLPPKPALILEKYPEPVTLGESLNPEGKSSLPAVMTTTDGFLETVRAGYAEDLLFVKTRDNPDQFNRFRWQDGLLYMDRTGELPVLCVPHAKHKLRMLTEIVIDQAHRTIGHAGSKRTNKYIHRFYWWSTLLRDVAKFCMTCGTCQAVKPSTQWPTGLLHPLPIPSRPWESIGMDFIGPLLPSPEGYNFIWVVIDRQWLPCPCSGMMFPSGASPCCKVAEKCTPLWESCSCCWLTRPLLG